MPNFLFVMARTPVDRVILVVFTLMALVSPSKARPGRTPTGG